MSEYITVERDGDDAVVYVGGYGNKPPLPVFRDKVMSVLWALRTAWTTLGGSLEYDQRPPPVAMPMGQVRRHGGLTAVKVSHWPGGWKVVGRDPVPLLYGWRDDQDVRDWDVVGDVLEGGAS